MAGLQWLRVVAAVMRRQASRERRGRALKKLRMGPALSHDRGTALHECVNFSSMLRRRDVELVLAGTCRQQLIDQPMHLERFAPRHSRPSPLVEGGEKVTPYAEMIMVREGHRIGPGAAGGRIRCQLLATAIMGCNSECGAGEVRRALGADQLDALGLARVGGGGGLDHADR